MASASFRVHPKFSDLRMFLAPNGKSKNWYAGFYHGGKYVRQSMGVADYSEAVRLASIWYDDKRYEIRHGTFVATNGPKFKTLIDPTLQAMQQRGKSRHYVLSTKGYLGETSYLRRYFGDLSVRTINARAWDDFRKWLTEDRLTQGKSPHSERTLHQMKNAVRLVMRQAYIDRIIDARPVFEDSFREERRDARPRTHFGWEEELALRSAITRNIHFHTDKKTRWVEDAKELGDFVYFMLATGLRIGEAMALRFCDVKVVQGDVFLNGEKCSAPICEVTIVDGKKGAHPTCVSHLGAAGALQRIVARRGLSDARSAEKLFVKYHRDMFRRVLQDAEIEIDGYGRKRDLMSLRHTYICNRLQDKVSVWDIARNTRTSVTMIQNHYAKALPIESRLINASVFEEFEYPSFG